MARKSSGKLSDADFKAILAKEIESALGAAGGSLSSERTKAHDYYLGRMDGHHPTRDGFSTATSSDVQDTVESLMPSLMEIFTGGDEVARFEPFGEEDEAAAQQETDVVNHVLMSENDGFIALHDALKDGLLLKTAILKHWWESSVEEERTEYRGLPPDGLALLMADGDTEIVAETRREDGLIDVDVVREADKGRVRLEAVPPEEFLLASGARSIKTARSAWHRRRLPASDLVAMGFAKKLVDKIPAWTEDNAGEAAARNTTEEEDSAGDDSANWAMREVEVYEGFLKADRDGDGIAEQIKVICDKKAAIILEEEPFVGRLFSVGSPIRQPHRAIGRSIADLVLEIQDINTAVTRGMLDNIYRVNAPRTQVPEDAMTEDTLPDLLRQDPGGYVRTRGNGGALTPITIPPTVQYALPVLEAMAAKLEQRTGVTRYNQGLDGDSLNKTATGISQIMSASQMRIRLVARIFAETLVKDAMLEVHGLIQRHDRVKKTIKLRNRWVEVDPSEWRERTNMTVTVGLGTGSREATLASLREIMGLQMKAIEMQGGAEGPLIKLTHVHHAAKKLIEASGYRGADAFIAEPDPNWAPPQKPNPEMQKAEAEAAAKKYEADADAELARDKANKDAEIEIYRAQLQAWSEMAKPAMAMGMPLPPMPEPPAFAQQPMPGGAGPVPQMPPMMSPPGAMRGPMPNGPMGMPA